MAIFGWQRAPGRPVFVSDLRRANPETFYLHVLGHGDPVKLAGVIHDALAGSKTPLTVTAAAPPPAVDLDTAQLDSRGRAVCCRSQPFS
jgi:hypothetical protein